MSSRNGRRGRGLHLDLYAFSDEELLALVKDNLDADGWVSSLELADAIGLDPEDSARVLVVGQRLSWMNRYGVVRKNSEPPLHPVRWTLSGRGIVILEATFSRSLEQQLGALKGEHVWRLARAVSDRYSQADEASANMVRRSFQRAQHRRRYG
jgi:hypothetical protein